MQSLPLMAHVGGVLMTVSRAALPTATHLMRVYIFITEMSLQPF